MGTGFIEAQTLPEEEPILPAAGPVIYGTKEWQTNLAAATAWAQDLTPMLGYAAVAGITGGNGKTRVIVTNASNDPSVPNSLAAAAEFSISNNGALIVLFWDGEFVLELTETITFGPNTTIAAPGFNWKIVTGDSTLNMIEFTGSNYIMKGVSVLRSIWSNGGDGFTYGADGWQAPPASPISLGTGNGTTLTFGTTLTLPPTRAYFTTISVAGIQVATDITAGTYNGGGVMGTMNLVSGAISATFATAPIVATAIQARYLTTTSLGTGDGTTTTFTGTVNTSAVPSTFSVLVSGVGVAGDNGSGVIGGPGIVGTINYGTGAFSVTFTTAPVAGAAITTNYAVLKQFGTGDGTTTTFTATLTGPFNSGICTIYTNGVALTSIRPPTTGTISGTNISGTIVYATGVVSVTWAAGHAPANGAALTVGFAASGQGAGDNIHLDPVINDKGWIYQCTIQNAPDGLLDIANSALLPSSPACRVTIQQNLLRWQDKGSAFGSDSAFIPIGTPPVILVSWVGNVSDGVASRSPRVGPISFAHSWNNLRILSPHIRPNGVNGEIYGLDTGNPSGSALVEGDLFIAAYDTTVYPGGYAASNVLGGGIPGALKVANSVAIGDLAFTPGNDGYVPIPPYAYTVNTIPPINTPAMGAYIAKIIGAAGAQKAGNGLSYIAIPKADATAGGSNYLVDGYNIDAQFDANGNWIGVYFATADDIQAPNPASGTTIALAVQSVTMAGGIATLTIPDNIYGIIPHTGTTDTLTNVVTDGSWQFANGEVITLQLAASNYVITLSNAGAGTPGSLLLPAGTYTMKGHCGNLVLSYGASLNSGLGGFVVLAFPLQI